MPDTMMQAQRSDRPDAAARAAMERDGYLVARGFFDATATADLLRWTEELYAAPEAAGRHWEGMLSEEWAPVEAAALALVAVPTAPGDVIFFDSFAPHASGPNLTDKPRRVLYLTYNLAEHGDQRVQYYADKHASFPPDVERDGTTEYVFRV